MEKYIKVRITINREKDSELYDFLTEKVPKNRGDLIKKLALLGYFSKDRNSLSEIKSESTGQEPIKDETKEQNSLSLNMDEALGSPAQFTKILNNLDNLNF